MSNAVIYARFSSTRQREESIEDQVRACSIEAARRGDVVLRTYADHAKTGTSTTGRDEFRQMVEDARRREFETVYVYKLDRFARDRYDSAVYRHRLRECGVEVRPVAESVPDGPEGIVLESVLEGMAEYYSANLSQNVRRGMDGNARKCLHNGVRVFGYGVGEDGRYVVDEEEAAIVREAFRRRSAGEGFKAIADDLAALGAMTPRGNPFNAMMVNNLIKNEKYTGVYTFGDVRVEGGMPRIVSDEEWAMAQRVQTKKRKTESNWTDFAFAGKGVCGGCGMNLVGVSGRGRKNKKYDYYRCSHKCGVPNVRAEVLEAAVADELRRLLACRDAPREVAQALAGAVPQGEREQRIKAAKRRASEAERGIRNLLRAVESGMDFSDVSGRLQELKLQQATAEGDLAYWEKAHDGVDTEALEGYLTKAAEMPDRQLLDLLVWQVILFDDEVAVVLNFDEDDKPARLVFPRGFEQLQNGGLDVILFESPRQTKMGLVQGLLCMTFRRAA